jgi:hypothetical protein
MRKTLYGGIGMACVAGFVWLVFLASKVPEQEQARRLAFLGRALGFALAGRSLMERPGVGLVHALWLANVFRSVSPLILMVSSLIFSSSLRKS